MINHCKIKRNGGKIRRFFLTGALDWLRSPGEHVGQGWLVWKVKISATWRQALSNSSSFATAFARNSLFSFASNDPGVESSSFRFFVLLVHATKKPGLRNWASLISKAVSDPGKYCCVDHRYEKMM